MKLLLTGASGFVARQIIPHLRDMGAELVLMSRDTAALRAHYPDLPSGGYDQWDTLGQGVDAVLHLAVKNNTQAGDADAFHDANVTGLEQTLTQAKSVKIPVFLYTSSLHADDGQASQTPYGASKRAAEAFLATQTGIDVKILRLAAVYGDEYAGKLAILDRFPAMMRPFLLRCLGALRPTLAAKTLAQAVMDAAVARTDDPVRVTDGQHSNLVFRIFKRCVDLAFVLFIGVGLFWALIIIWGVVKFTSDGPGIFAQARVGRHGKVFTCYKFRTMQAGTKQAGTHEVTGASVTSVGAFLRKTKLDELPQIVNILKGEVSLIGPRPCLPVQTDVIAARQAVGALDVRPGISGLAQIRNIDMSTPTALAQADAEYIALQSIPLELKIILATATGGGQGDKIRD